MNSRNERPMGIIERARRDANLVQTIANATGRSPAEIAAERGIRPLVPADFAPHSTGIIERMRQDAEASVELERAAERARSRREG